jgi:hypothetical protein
VELVQRAAVRLMLRTDFLAKRPLISYRSGDAPDQGHFTALRRGGMRVQ